MPKSFSQMPGPRGIPVFGNALTYSRFGKHSFDRLHLAKLENYQKYGKVYRERLGPNVTIVQLFDPADAAAVFRADGTYPQRPPIPITIASNKRDGLPLGLGSLNGTGWYRLRSSTQQLMMRPASVSRYLPAQDAVAEDFLHLLASHGLSAAGGGVVHDFNSIILRYTMESIGTVCFSARLGVLAPVMGDTASRLLHASQRMFDAVQRTTFAFPWYFLFRTPLYKQFVNGKKSCNSIAMAHLEEAMSTASSSSMCPFEPSGAIPDSADPNFLRSLAESGRLTADDILGITMDLFIAGIDSTANALSFAIYNLSRNVEKQERLAVEICRVLRRGQPVTAEAINSMPYLKACVKESFRLNFPIEGGTTRILNKDTVIQNYVVPKGTIVAFNNQTMCLQEEYFEDAGSYNPERWLKDGSATTKPPPKFVMMPFGHGARMCIGRRFAEQEIYLALIKLIQNFKLEYTSHEEIGMINRVFTMPDKPLLTQFQH